MKIRLIFAVSVVVALAALVCSFVFAETWLDRPLSTHVAVILGRSVDSLEPLPGDRRDGMDVVIGVGAAYVSQYYSTENSFSDEVAHYASHLTTMGWGHSRSSQSIYRNGQLCARVAEVDQTHYAVEFGWRTTWCDPSGLANQTFAVAIALAGLSQLSLVYWVTKGVTSTPATTTSDPSAGHNGDHSETSEVPPRKITASLPAGCVAAVLPSAASMAVLMLSGVWLAINIAAFQI